MELKQALAASLIAVVAATLVVLVARSLDNQAAARIEPQLVRIAEQLEAIRAAGGVAAGPTLASGATGSPATSPAGLEGLQDGLIVYYFHSNTRCPTCRSIEAQARQIVETDYAAPLAEGKVVWKTLNYEQPANAELAKKFDIQVPVVVLARVEQGKIAEWDRLDQVWALVGDPPAYEQYVRGELSRMFGAVASAPTPAPTPAPMTAGALPSLPVPQPAEQPAAPAWAPPDSLPIPDGETASPGAGPSDAPAMLPTSGELPAPSRATDAPPAPRDEPSLLWPSSSLRPDSRGEPAAEIGFPR